VVTRHSHAAALVLIPALLLCQLLSWGAQAAPAKQLLPGRPGAAWPATSPTASAYLRLAEEGVVRAERVWSDRRLGWYDERLNDHARYPLATIWGAVPLFEALDAVDIAAPSPAHRAAVVAFANGAERYYDTGLRPTPGYAPYPDDRGQAPTWFDDNGWWGIAFMDAYRATGSARYLRDAERAFAFIAAQGWDAAGGGLWWNTSHSYRAGEALAAGTLLGALLYQRTHRSFYLNQIDMFLNWADAHFLTELGLYARTESDPTPTPYVEGPLVEAHQILCQAGQQAACVRARQLANACWQRFEERLNMGPQFDTIYLHWMLVYAAQTGDSRWPSLAMRMASNAQTYALDTQQGLYLRAWDGTSITAHEAQPNMLQTDAATLELFAWLSAGEASA
jgi:Glycosyl hydrolase family 76